VRGNYYPDVDVARLRLYGNPEPAKQVQCNSPVVMSPLLPHCHGPHLLGRAPRQHWRTALFQPPTLPATLAGRRRRHLLQPALRRPFQPPAELNGPRQGDGWETARHPVRPGILVKNEATGLVDSNLSDWAVLQLGRPARSVQAVILDTRHFRGNYPESVQVEGCFFCDEPSSSNKDSIINNNEALLDDALEWFPLVPRGRMAPDAEHLYEASKCYDDNDGGTTPQLLHSDRPVSHVRVSIYPDGGLLSRVRVYGVPLLEADQ